MPPEQSRRVPVSSCSIPQINAPKSTARQGACAPIPKTCDATIRGSAQNAVAGEAHSSENETRKSLRNRRFSVSNGVKRGGIRPKRRPCSGLDVQQILAGELHLVGDAHHSHLARRAVPPATGCRRLDV